MTHSHFTRLRQKIKLNTQTIIKTKIIIAHVMLLKTGSNINYIASQVQTSCSHRVQKQAQQDPEA